MTDYNDIICDIFDFLQKGRSLKELKYHTFSLNENLNYLHSKNYLEAGNEPYPINDPKITPKGLEYYKELKKILKK